MICEKHIRLLEIKTRNNYFLNYAKYFIDKLFLKKKDLIDTILAIQQEYFTIAPSITT